MGRRSPLVPTAPTRRPRRRALGVPYAHLDAANLRGQNVWNGALSAIDYETGEIIAYVGSADYYERRKVASKIQPQFDVLADGWRQPGSAFKPFNYATGIDDGSADGLLDAHGRHDRLRWRLHADRLHQPRARPAARPPRAPVLAQHPGGQGARHHRRARACVRARAGVRAWTSSADAPRPACRWRWGPSRSSRST